MKSKRKSVQEPSLKEGCEIILVPLETGHSSFIYKHLNHKKIANTYPISLPYTLKDAQLYVAHEIRSRQRETGYAFAIALDNQFVGVCALYDVNKLVGEAKLYYWVAVAFWNRGIATHALKKLMVFAKNELKISCLKTGVLERNMASRRVLEKNGFILEDTLKNITEYHAKFIGEQILEIKVDLQEQKA